MKIFKNTVYTILDFKGALINDRGYFYPGVTRAVRSCLDVGIVFYIVRFIGVKDLYEYQSNGRHWRTTLSNSLFETTSQWIAEMNIPTSREGAAPGKGWIADCLIVDDRTGRPHNSRALVATKGVHKHQSAGGKDYFWYFHGNCAAILDDHAGNTVACLEIGMRAYLIRPRRIDRGIRPQGLYAFAATSQALEQLRIDASDLTRSWDLEQRQRHILGPTEYIHDRTNEGDIQHQCYSRVKFEPWNAAALRERANDRNKLAYCRVIPNAHP